MSRRFRRVDGTETERELRMLLMEACERILQLESDIEQVQHWLIGIGQSGMRAQEIVRKALDTGDTPLQAQLPQKIREKAEQ